MLVLWKDKQDWQTFGPTNKKKEMIKLKNEQEYITIDTKKVQSVVREYNNNNKKTNLYSVKLENLKGMNKFLGLAKTQKLSQQP